MKYYLLAWILLIGLGIIWGSSFIAIKIGLEVLSPLQVASIRLLTAILILVPPFIYQIRQIPKDQYIWLLLSGLCGSLIPAILFAVAQQEVPSGIAGVMNALVPIWVMVIGFFIFRMIYNRWQISGIFLGLLGSVILLISGEQGWGGINFYSILIVFGTLCYATNLNIIKNRISGIKPGAISAMAFLFISPASLVLFFIDFPSHLDLTNDSHLFSLGIVILLGFLGTGIALMLFYYLVSISTPLFSSTVTYIMPLVAILWGFWDGEIINIIQLSSVFLILTGILLTSKKSKTN